MVRYIWCTHTHIHIDDESDLLEFIAWGIVLIRKGGGAGPTLHANPCTRYENDNEPIPLCKRFSQVF